MTGGPNLSGFVAPTAWNLALVDCTDTLDEAFLFSDLLMFGTKKNQHRSDVPMTFEEEYRDMRQMSCVFLAEIRCGHAWARAFSPFSDQISQPEAFNAPVARGRNMCCVAH